jgi:XTP/dITP diphosphohydrolase
MGMMKILLASHNKDKATEFRGLLRDLRLELATLDEFPHIGPVEEDAPTLEGNAVKKAREVFRLTGIPALADDTGLEVRYLNDAPGVFSSRFAGPGASYDDNVRKLLQVMRGVPPRRRGARFRAVLAFVPATGQQELAEGIVHGMILESPRGTGGFGYDPIFLPHGYSKTYAEMDLKEKNQVSHRARAMERMKEILKRHV